VCKCAHDARTCTRTARTMNCVEEHTVKVHWPPSPSIAFIAVIAFHTRHHCKQEAKMRHKRSVRSKPCCRDKWGMYTIHVCAGHYCSNYWQARAQRRSQSRNNNRERVGVWTG
jgi:hypothetical protein